MSKAAQTEKQQNPEETDRTKKLMEDQARRRDVEFKQQRRKELLEWIFLLSVLFGTAAYYSWKTVQRSLRDLLFYTTLNQTTNQISQLVDNVRNTYKIRNLKEISTMDSLIETGAIPKILIDEFGNVKNPFGGDIVIETSEPLENIKEAVTSPTFKMSYQGLSHRACVALARMNWGDKLKGLLAVAIGQTDPDTGIDNALTDVDAKPKKVKEITFIDSRGRTRVYRPRQELKMNIAKPNDDFMPTPFTEDGADAGCTCSVNRNCTFALRYTIFGVDKPNRGGEDEENKEKQ